MKELESQLKELQIEDYIWILFYFIATAALISDFFERHWLITKNPKDYKIFKNINIILLLISFFVYLYYVVINYKHYKEVKNTKSVQEMFLKETSFVAASLFLVGALLYIYVEIKSRAGDEDILL